MSSDDINFRNIWKTAAATVAGVDVDSRIGWMELVHVV